MPRTCALSGRKPSFGRKYALRGIAKKKKGIGLKITGCTNRRFLPNLQTRRLWIPEKKQYITMRISVAALRSADKKGLGTMMRQAEKKAKRVVV